MQSRDVGLRKAVRVPLPGEGRPGLRGHADGVLVSARDLDTAVT